MEKQEILDRIEFLEADLKKIKGSECEIYSRVVGYFRPVKQWNDGKQEEYNERKTFEVEKKESKVYAV